MFGIFGGGDSGFGDERNRLYRLMSQYKDVKDPELKDLSFEKYNPETANYSLNKGDAESRNLQLQALQRLSGLAESGLSDADQAAFAKAKSQGAQIARQGTEAAIANAQARGVGGGGMEFAMREMANQGGAQRANEAALEQAGQAARQRAMYQQAYGNALSGFRGQNEQQEANNTDIINRFNQMNTQGRNQAQMQNINQRQDVARYGNDMSQRRYDNRMGSIDRQTGVEKQMNSVSAAEEARRRKQQGNLIGAAGAIAGGIYGGPAGAGAGYTIGSSLGGG
jgi:hypothetical protein